MLAQRFVPVLVLVALVTAPLRGQTVSIRLDRFIPDVARTKLPTLQVQYALTATPTSLVDVFLQLSDGSQTTIAGLDPANGPFVATVTMPTTPMDGQVVTVNALARRQDNATFALAPRPLTVVFDNVGPRSLAITSPTFPAIAYANPFIVRGQVLASTGPETGGVVTVRRRDAAGANRVVGAGAILSDGRFVATIDLTGFPMQVAIPVAFQATDATGNAGAELVVTMTNADPKGNVQIDGLQLSPPAGTVTNTGLATLQGSVSGDVEPFTVTFLVDGFVSSQITGLRRNDRFRHTLALAGDGTKNLTVRASDAGGAQAVVTAGSVVVDTAPPAPPTLLSPSIVVTNQPTITIKGSTPERPPTADSTQRPKILVRGPPTVTFTPSQPQLVTDPAGRFETVADVSRLPDGHYTFEIFVIDAAGNVSSASTVGLGAGGVRRSATSRDVALGLTLPRALRRVVQAPTEVR